jgi:hypothetical protein
MSAYPEQIATTGAPSAREPRFIDISSASRPLRLMSWGKFIMIYYSTAAVFIYLAELLILVIYGPLDEIVALMWVGVTFTWGLIAFTNWRQIGKLGFLGSKIAGLTLTLITIICVSIVIFLIVLLKKAPQIDEDTSKGIITGIVVFFIPVFSSTLAFVGLIWSSHTRIRIPWQDGNDHKVRIKKIVDRSKVVLGREYGQLSVPSAQPFMGWGMLLIAFALSFLWAVLPDKLTEYWAASSGYNFGLAMLVVYARKYFQPSLTILLQRDHRPATLFLRSYVDEQRKYPLHRFLIASGTFDFSLESRLAGYFCNMGPFVAIGAPESSGTQLGAIRANVAEDQWQKQVLELMANARTIVLLAGVTESLKWELQQVLAGKYYHKLIIVFPEDRFSAYPVEPSRRLQKLKTVLIGSRWQSAIEACPDDTAKSFRSVVLNPDGSLYIVKSHSKGRDTYHLAVIVAHYLLLCKEDQRVARA